ncbi:conserved hypothetical protein [Capnocytophaga canimorsus]|uniref:N-acetyltransferase domain-containing protein n=1 Tax=Capnocytophaga canimorsus TaxID=28188 RepID=A0A0B7HQ15_9FLAO|nr:hypothetical protein [Capnocytophaga canimorsus]CEN41410.1 conserved hypothetical protein [Capnocytophaga canimorsus]
MVTIKEVNTAKQLKTFIYLPEKIHQSHKNWLPPLYLDEEKFFSHKRNPAFQHADTILFLAYRGEQAVGRIMGIIPHEYNRKNGVQCVRFSYFECYEDELVFKELLLAVERWGKSKNCKEMVGPMGFSDKEPQGFLTQGFTEPTMLITNCSFEYMKIFIEKAGFESFVRLYQYQVPLTENVMERYQKFTQRVEARQSIIVHEFTRTRQVRPFIAGVFELINNSYKDIYGFSPVTKKETEEFANRFLPLLNPKLIKIICDLSGKVIAFVIAMPDLSGGIRKAEGRLFPLGWVFIYYKLLENQKN